MPSVFFIPDDMYKVLVKHEKKCTAVKWFCNVCEQQFGKIRMEIKVLAGKQVLLEAAQTDVGKSVVDIKQEVVHLKREFLNL